MLPELLFSVGSSMQDISRDDFNLLNGGCEKDIIVHSSTGSSSPPLSSAEPPITIQSTTANVGIYNACSNRSSQSLNAISPNLDTVVSSIKLEDSSNNSDLYSTTASWHHPHHSSELIAASNKLLLRNSDDPLISRGAATCVDDDNPNELKFIVSSSAAQAAVVVTEQPNPITKTKHKKTTTKKTKNPTSTTNGQPPRTRRKGAFKLRFHHQALPAEYLSHYEETQNQLEARNAAAAAAAALAANNNNNGSKKATQQQQQKQEKCTVTTHDNVRNWLQKIAEMQANAAKENINNAISGSSVSKNKNNNNKNDAMEIEEDLISGNKNDLKTHHLKSNILNVSQKLTSSSSSSAVTRSNNTQQHQQRIIKYSDLPYMGEMTLENSKPRRGRKPKKADICHLIYKNYGTIFPGTPKNLMKTGGDSDNVILNDRIEEVSLLKKSLIGKDLKDVNNNHVTGEEPLNLCLRDQSESLTISSDEDESDDLVSSNSTTPLITTSSPDAVNDAVLAANLKMSLPNFQTAMLDKIQSTVNDSQMTAPSTVENDKTLTKKNENYGNYWPNGNGLFIHPMALYYQKMIDSGSLPPPKPKSPQTPNSPSSKTPQSPISPKLLQSPKISSPKLLSKREKCSTPSSVKSFASSSTATSATTTTNSTKTQPPQKRKRSAIFIPPMPAENTSNPATEVSICKFKFTGGAKPSLQEKKMLSVDSDGNYRYYSGTGDKSTRGYEFFPRESLQQSGVVPGVNCSGAFLNATGEKISNDLPPPSAGLSNELLQIPDTPPGGLILSPSLTSPGSREHHNLTNCLTNSPTDCSSDRRKRKSRRSDQREKLEQTFKDKGFLIQTQQLESAEGATYCKFRQLKKFTRYLFRSWKDYLPGDAGPVVAAAASAASASNTTQTQQQSAVVASVNQM